MSIISKILNYRLNRSVFKFRRPDLVDERRGRTLMVWNAQAYWNVIDNELKEFVGAFDGRRTLLEIVESAPAWAAQYDAIVGCVKALAGKGVLYSSDGAVKNAAPASAIENVTVNVTGRCNLKCTHCYYNEKLNRGGHEIGGADVARFLRAVRKHCAEKPALFLLGGEPLMARDRLEQILAEAAVSGFRTSVSTNGTLVDDIFIDLALKYKFSVQVSLDGPDAETNDQVRGSGAFARAVAGVRRLADKGVETILCMTCHGGNIERIEDYYKLALGLNAAEARVIPLKMIGNAMHKNMTPAGVSAIVEKCAELLVRRPEYRRLSRTDALSIMLETCRYSQSRASCGSGTQTVLLDADGSVYPCLNTNFDFLRIGGVGDADFSFDREWAGSKPLNEFRQDISSDCEASECRGCGVWNWCLGGCHGETYIMKESFAARPYNCEDLKRAIVNCFWLISEHPCLTATEKD
ncbi:MAG TPA: radical SAM protein [Candidatus Wallbacteria bacterium]|nr:radical SAM protein [Candidatus Wallbacteria bacterium]